MNSAAVIGRQLRQQQTGGRTSGPLVPPAQPGKGRPRTPSHIPQRPYSPAPASLTGTGTGTGESRLNVISGAGTGYHQYPSPHPAARGEKDSKKKQQDEPRIRCTWHCFCVALKALSGGIVLLVAGTVMSVVGFVAEANHVKQQQGSANATEVGEHIRNLTFAGPVIMGLGGIVIVAALVLTFEVRDTLGVKVVPVKPDKQPANMDDKASTSNNTGPSAAAAGRKNTIASISSGLKASGGDAESVTQKGAVNEDTPCDGITTTSGTGRQKPSTLTLPFAVLSDLSHEPMSSSGGFSKDRLQETIHETVFSETASGNGVPGTLSSAGSGRSALDQQVSISRRRYAAADQCITSPSSGTTFSHLLSPNIETLYFGLPSPQDTECSDPEGCSLTVPTRWKSSRCSCSGSPTHSLSMDIYLEENDPPISVKIIEQQRLQQQLILQQQLLLQQQQQQLQLQQKLLQQQQAHRHTHHRRPKTIASIESDGLSTTSSSSSSDDIFLSQKSNAPLIAGHTLHNSYEQNELTAPLLGSTAKSSSCCSPSTTTTTADAVKQCAAAATTMLRGSRDNITAVSAKSNSVDASSAAADKRFPLLRQTALGNGSVAANNKNRNPPIT